MKINITYAELEGGQCSEEKKSRKPDSMQKNEQSGKELHISGQKVIRMVSAKALG
jgi:hypothetical protein